MTIPNTLPVSRLISVQVTLTPTAIQAQNFQTMLLIGPSTIIDTTSRMRSYTTLPQVAADFGTSAPEYLSAVQWFAQGAGQLYIGRWVNAPCAGQLIGAPLTAAQQALSIFTPITTGSIKFTFDVSTVVTLTALNFSAVGNMNAVAAVIQAALTTADAGATIVWNSVYQNFTVTSATTGVTSAVGFSVAPGSGTDVGGLIGLKVTNLGSYQAQGQAAETALACVTLFDQRFGQQWFGLSLLADPTDADYVAIGSYIEASSNFHFHGATTQEATVLVASDTTNLAYLLKQVNLTRTAVQYSSSSPYAIVSLLGRILTTNYTGNNTVINLMYKQEPTVVAENLTTTQINAIQGFNCNVFDNYNNGTSIIENGVTSAGAPYYIDTVIGTMALAAGIQTAAYNALYGTATKIPQTDAGMNIIQTAIEQVCTQFVTNGLLAPGTWTSTGFGTYVNNPSQMTVAKGYYVYAPPVALQPSSNRALRLSVPFQVAAKLAGAVNTVNVSVLVNN